MEVIKISNVVKSERKQSSAQFASTMLELTKLTTALYIKLPKRLQNYMFESIVKSVNEAYKEVMIIRRMYSRENSDLILRIKMCKKVIGKIEYASSMLEIIKSILEKNQNCNITAKQWSSWASVAVQEIKLLTGLVKREREEFQKLNFNPLDFSDPYQQVRWREIEHKLGISMFEEDLIEELNLRDDGDD